MPDQHNRSKVSYADTKETWEKIYQAILIMDLVDRTFSLKQ